MRVAGEISTAGEAEDVGIAAEVSGDGWRGLGSGETDSPPNGTVIGEVGGEGVPVTAAISSEFVTEGIESSSELSSEVAGASAAMRSV
jgi:hypothetical protein